MLCVCVCVFGAGRNLPYYDFRAVRSLTAVDRSLGMLKETQRKWDFISRAAQLSRGQHSPTLQPQLTALQMDIDRLSVSPASPSPACPSPASESAAPSALPLPAGSFDCVVDTFGLCSYSDELAALREMGRLVKPGSGRILLLQHGRRHRVEAGQGQRGGWAVRAALSGWLDAAVNGYLARHRARHLSSWGCEWDRDHEAALRTMVQRHGWRILDVQHFHAGTGLMLVAQVDAESGVEDTAVDDQCHG